ncbi:dachshund homolog 1-like isoform X1 [Haliotis cracherodii]|uniref:dachshund homolog 1-like isoform X1 n=1 Tax=Haliotis rufescens TaxID=6454 RepID=UPI001EAFC141|nr:dachshund homolog 1-like isoform X1 [Haliotis rufescens]
MIAMESPSQVLPHQMTTQPSPTPGLTPSGHNPLNLMSKLQKPGTYSSPPPVACHPENNVCKLIEYRGAKVAAFMVDGRELICLPQAFELFLKHLVGGLHTVYTKLKRLDITPVVCNVEQVRILRGLGAIQPGVNRCKLISCKEFDILYDDCTNSSARPGRPPKRSPSIHASPETIEKLKKSRLDGSDYQFDPRLYGLSYFPGDRKSLLNGFPHHPYAMGPLPFMPLTHPMMSPPVSMAMAQHLGLRPDGSIIKDRSSSESDLMSPRGRDDGIGKSPYDTDRSHPRMMDNDSNKPLNLHVNGHLKDAYKSVGPLRSDDDDDDPDDDKMSEDDRDDDLDDSVDINDSFHAPGEVGEKVVGGQHGHAPQLLNGEATGISSIETLLLNIQGLLKVAAENARHHERQITLEKAELKMELLREKEAREQTEKQLMDEQKNRVILQKRLKKEKKARRRIQEQLEVLAQQGGQPGVPLDTCKAPNSPESTRNNADSIDQDSDGDKHSQCDSGKKTPDLSDGRSNHRDIFETFPPPHTLSSARFPYLPMVQNEVQ